MSIHCEKVDLGWELKGTDYLVSAIPTNLPSIAAKWKVEKCILYSKYAQYADDLYNFKVRPDDIWVISFPKTGTTWTQEMVWMLYNNLDYKTSSSMFIEDKFTFLERGIIFDKENNLTEVSFIDALNRMPSPRFLKSHLPAQLLPKELWLVKPRIVYVTRNPKDTAISFYHHLRNIRNWKVDFRDFLDKFLSNKILFQPFHTHVLNFWSMRNEENILFLTYEKMKDDLKNVLDRTSKFLGKSYSDDELTDLEQHLSVASMQQHPSTNNEHLVTVFLNIIDKPRLDENYRYLSTCFPIASKVGAFYFAIVVRTGIA